MATIPKTKKSLSTPTASPLAGSSISTVSTGINPVIHVGSPLSVSAFLETIKSSLGTKEAESLTLVLAQKSLKGGTPQFFQYYASLNPPQQKMLLIKKRLFEKQLSAYFVKNKGLSQAEYDFFKKEPFLDLKFLLALKEIPRFIDTANQAEALIHDLLPKNERLEALRDFMTSYESYYKQNKPFPKAEIENHKAKLRMGEVERKEIPTVKYELRTTKTGNRYNKAVASTKKVKTEDQKTFEQMLNVFLSFAARHIRSDFLEVLEILELDFLKALSKVKNLNTTEVKAVWKNMTTHLDLTAYFESLDEKNKEKFITAFADIYLSISAPAMMAYTKNGIKAKLLEPFKTQEHIRQWIDAAFTFHKAGYTKQEVEDMVGIFNSQLNDPTVPVAQRKNGLEILIEKGLPIKGLKAEKLRWLEQLRTIYEKEKLEKAIGLAAPAATTKIKIHKI